MKVLFATTNPAKVAKYREELQKRGIELITLNDLDTKIHVEESGKNAIENAYLKAKAYYDLTHLPTIGMDNNLFIEGLPEELQPGVFVRRVNGKELNDEEMILHYTNLVKRYGGKLKAKWIYGMVLISNNVSHEYSWSKSEFYLVDKAHEKRNPGYPLDSIAVDMKLNKYFVELTKEDKLKNDNQKLDDDVIKFIINCL